MSETFTTSLHIEAPPERVFEHFTRPELLVRWMGEYARLEAVEGGQFSVDINGVLIRGSFIALDWPRRIEIAWGEPGNAEMPPGATTLQISLEPSGAGTQLTLVHSGLLPAELEKHAMGWPHFLARLVVAAAGDDPGPDPWATDPPG